MVDRPEQRDTPLWRHVVLLVGFVLIVITAVATVLLPELEDTEEPGAHPPAEEASEPARDPPAGSGPGAKAPGK